MKIDLEKINVVHNIRARRFEIKVDQLLAVLEYEMHGNRIVFTHTGVPPALEGQGVASRLARVALEHARENSYKVVPACEFMDVYIRRHREYQPLVRGEG